MSDKRHYQFAPSSANPEWERRLLQFADSDDGNLESEKQAAEKGETESNNETLDALSSDIRGKLDKVQPLIAQATVNSPFVLREALDVLEQEQDGKVGEIDELVLRGKLYLETIDAGQEDEEQKRAVLARIEGLLDRSDLSSAITRAFERRAGRYQELDTMIGGTDLSELATVENELKLREEGSDLLSTVDQWSEKEVNALAERLDIDETIDLKKGYDLCTPEEQAAIDALIRDTEISAEDSDSKKRKLLLIYKKLLAARKLAAMEKGDLGTEKSLDSMQETEKAVSKQLMHARKHLERTLQLRAVEMRKKWEPIRNSAIRNAADSGLSEDALARRILEIEDTMQRAFREVKESEDADNLPKTSDVNFTKNAQKLLEELDDLSWLESDDDSVVQKGLLGTDHYANKATEAWLEDNASQLQRACTILQTDTELSDAVAELVELDGCTDIASGLQLYADIASRVSDGTATQQDRNVLYRDLSESTRRNIQELTLAISSPGYLDTLRRNKKKQDAETTSNTEQARNAVWEDLKSVEGALFTNGVNSAPKHPLLQHEACRALQVGEQLSGIFARTESTLRTLPKTKGPKADSMLQQCKLQTATLQEVLNELNQLDDVQSSIRIRSIPADRVAEYGAIAGTQKSNACYNRRDGMIYINEKAIADRAARSHISEQEVRSNAIYHETGHAIVDMLTLRTGALPGLFSGVSKVLSQEIPGDSQNRTVRDLLLARSDAWHVEKNRERIVANERSKITGLNADAAEALAQQRTDALMEELLMDELINKYASWKNEGSKQSVPKENLELFTILDGKHSSVSTGSFDTSDISDGVDIILHSDDEDDEDEDAEPHEREEPIEDIGEKIIKLQNQILLYKEFVKSHMSLPGAAEFKNFIEQGEDQFIEHIQKPFYEKTTDEEEINNNILILKEKYIDVVENQIGKIKNAEMAEKDSGEKKIRGLMDAVRYMRFVSIYDMINMVKTGAEDIQRMWKRAGEAKQAEIGEGITSWISDKIPYAGQLKHEYKRRSHASELEEVKQWKDALNEADSIELEEQLAGSNNQDQVRAIIEILVERGRLDWNNQKLWLTLKRLSGMNMPVEACKNNSILRDKWLQDMVTGIWNDKDKYFDWRQSNDSGIDSGKKKFTQVADQLSNFSGGLASRLEHQLTMWVDAKNSKSSIPEDVNPHLYEEILHYAMRNGKMSMEQKMYYLVQGIAVGLISIDRLQALAGENGGVLNQFPMIDYFTGKNNTMPEVRRLAARLKEGDEFKPGNQTTIWLHMEVLRDKEAKERMSKATSGARTEQLDHEDIPTIMAQADRGTVMDLTGVLSGTRFKMSREAAKNAYTGFGTKFKVLARLAALKKSGQGRFSKKDAAEAAQSISSYILYDNIITRNSADAGGRMNMSMSELNTTGAPSTGGQTVSVYRDSNSSFVRDLLSQLNIDGIDQPKIDNLVRTKDTQHNSYEGGDISKDATMLENQKIMETFQTKLTKALADSSNFDILIEVLSKHGELLHQEGEDPRSRESNIQVNEVQSYIGNKAKAA